MGNCGGFDARDAAPFLAVFVKRLQAGANWRWGNCTGGGRWVSQWSVSLAVQPATASFAVQRVRPTELGRTGARWS